MGKHKEKSHKRDKKSKKEKKRRYSSSSSSSQDEWVEKHTETPEKASSNRDEWMSLSSSSFLTESNVDRRKNRQETKRLEREREKYDPRTQVRELNPYWKDGGDGLPKFKKPTEESDQKYKSTNKASTSSNWRKKEAQKPEKEPPKIEVPTATFTSKDLNALAAKLVKAEIMGNTKLIRELKQQLEIARESQTEEPHNNEVLLTQTNSQGHSRPARLPSSHGDASASKKKKVETHKDGERVRYFADDDKHSLQEMFENEKFSTIEDQNAEFLKMAGKIRKNDDMDEIFADNIRKEESESKVYDRNRDKAINEHQKKTRTMENCRFCIQSESMPKHLMVSYGETVFLMLPPHEPLTPGHCLITPIRHVSSSTLLDENEWTEIMNFRKALTRLFLSKNEDVIFFETAKYLDKHPHMTIECVPLDKEEGESAPIYFKKAIDESETEWAQNKKLVSLKNRDVRKAIPKGLPYFFVSFGMQEGYAHVIEDEHRFPNNFAQEIIGGMLDLDHSKWRRPKMQSFEGQSNRVVEFSKDWASFDCTIPS